MRKKIRNFLGINIYKGDYRTDMYLPDWILLLGVVLIGGSIFLGAEAVVTGRTIFIAATVSALLIGIMAILCWRNQKIRIVSSDKFEYTTFLGTKKIYCFSDITHVKQNPDSVTLFVKEEKVHIETCAIMSDTLLHQINDSLEKVGCEYGLKG